MAKNKGGREVRKPKADKAKHAEPAAKGMSEIVHPAKVTQKRPGSR